MASVTLLLLSLQFFDFRESEQDEDRCDAAISEMGMLHAIWLCRNHPELEKLLEQVVHPTDVNLRKAGMVRVRLVDHGLGGLVGRWD